MSEPRDESRAYPFRNWRLFGLAVFGFLATLIAALCSIAAPGSSPEHGWLARVGGGVLAVLFAALTVFAASRLFGRKPGLVSVRVERPPGVRMRDPQRLIDGGSLAKRWLLRGTLAWFGSPVAISPANVLIDTDQLARYIRRIVGPS